MMNDMVVVTLQCQNFEEDFELPWNISLSELYPRLFEVLKKVNPAQFEHYTGIFLVKDGKGLINFEASLFDYGIHMGSRLQIVGEEKYFE